MIVVVFLAWATYKTHLLLREIRLEQNLLLVPAENLVRLGLIAICVWLGLISGQPRAQLGWVVGDPAQDLATGFFVGMIVAAILPPLTRWAVTRFGRGIYSPIVIRAILPRSRREWILVPLALIPSVVLEELLFRSLVPGGFSDFVSPLVIALGASVLFGAMHVPQGALGIVVATLLSVLLCVLFGITRNVIAPLTAHYVIDAVQIAWASVDREWLEGWG
jgi:membrane protease YdiL (CAAX protease family)